MNQFYQSSKMDRKDWHAPAPGINNYWPWLVGLSISIEESSSPAHPRSRAHLTPAENCNIIEEHFSNRSLERFLSLSNFGVKNQGVVSVKVLLSHTLKLAGNFQPSAFKGPCGLHPFVKFIKVSNCN